MNNFGKFIIVTKKYGQNAKRIVWLISLEERTYRFQLYQSEVFLREFGKQI